MINFVTTAGHGSTLKHLVPALGVPARRWAYEQLLHRSRLPGGTWIFTDHERLSPFELNVAANIAEQLRGAVCRVLNHPAEVRSRVSLLAALRKAGINDFSAFRADEDFTPSRFPVFIRRDFDHHSDARELLHSQAELDAALRALRAEGVPLAGRLVIEYAGEEAAPGVWYRGSAYRAGDAIIAHHMALDEQWLVKDGFDADRLEGYERRGEFIARERSFVINNEYADLLRRVFDIAGLQYGRADFGFVGDGLRIYEINTNPTHGSAQSVFGHIHPERDQTQHVSEDRLHDALRGVATEAKGSVALTGSLLAAQRKLLPLRLATWRRP